MGDKEKFPFTLDILELALEVIKRVEEKIALPLDKYCKDFYRSYLIEDETLIFLKQQFCPRQ